MTTAASEPNSNLGEPGVSPRTSAGTTSANTDNEFETAATEPIPGFWREFASFLVHSPSWWLTPLVIVLVLLGLAVTMIPVEAMPFIYTLW